MFIFMVGSFPDFKQIMFDALQNVVLVITSGVLNECQMNETDYLDRSQNRCGGL